MSFRTKSLVSVSALAGLFIVQPACSSGDDVVEGNVELIDRTTQALSIGDLESVNGTYLGCTDHTDGEPWSVAVAVSPALDHPVLDVVLNDGACSLVVTHIRTTLGGNMAASAPIDLDVAYASAASSFGTPIQFYANASIDSTAFTTDFVINVLFSDNPANATDSNTAAFGVVESSATAELVPAPDYALSLAGIDLVTDAANEVTEADGDATLTEGLEDGEGYVLIAGGGLTTYAQLNTAYLGNGPAAVPLTLAADADFGLLGDDLSTPQVQTLIIANIVSGVRSYQSFQITFNPAP